MRRLLLATAFSGVALAGCAAPDPDTAIREAGRLVGPFAQGLDATLNRSDGHRADAARRATELLAKTLTMEGATQLAIANSPAFQAALAEGWAGLSAAHQRGLPGNPLFTFERLRDGSGLELGRMISIGLLDLLTLPQRRAVARVAGDQARVRLAGAIVDQAGAAKQAWVRAVAAREMERYSEQVRDTADASAELARRMQRAGNGVDLLTSVVDVELGGRHDTNFDGAVPDYMVMGERGMADMGEMEMPVPDNTAPMMGGDGPFGGIEMGGMFTTVKVRRDQKRGDYTDPGWFKHPQGTVAYEFTGQLPEPLTPAGTRARRGTRPHFHRAEGSGSPGPQTPGRAFRPLNRQETQA